jgi:hypothetical protein
MPFRHPDGRQIDALYYRFEDSGGLVVWLNEQGEDERGQTVNESGKLLVTTQPGEYLVSRGKRYGPVESVRPYPFEKGRLR